MRTGDAIRRQTRGFTMLIVLAALAILGIMSSVVMTFVSQQAQREREQQLVWVGNAYVGAIRSYYEQSPGRIKSFPRRVDDLLDDSRFISTRRHLRQAYPDPTNLSPLELIRQADGGIIGVRSNNPATPIRIAPSDGGPSRRGTYADWEFLYRPSGGTAP